MSHFGEYYYPETIKGIVVAFGSLFSDIVVRRKDDEGGLSKEILVPLKFGPVDKFRSLRVEGESGSKYYLPLPAMAYRLGNLSYASNRVTSSLAVRCIRNPDLPSDAINSLIRDMNPVPYNYPFTLSINTESFDECSQILERILPYFNPTITIRVKEFPDINIERDIIVTLTGDVAMEMLDPQPENNRRYVNATINFVAEGFMYKPYSHASLIKRIKTNFYIKGKNTEDILEDLLVTSKDTSGILEVSAFEALDPSEFSYKGFVQGIGSADLSEFYIATKTENHI